MEELHGDPAQSRSSEATQSPPHAWSSHMHFTFRWTPCLSLFDNDKGGEHICDWTVDIICFVYVDGYYWLECYGFMSMLLKILVVIDIDAYLWILILVFIMNWLCTMFQGVSSIFKGNSAKIFKFSLCICSRGVLKLKLNRSLIFW